MFALWELWGGRSSTPRVCRRAWKTALKYYERRRTRCASLRHVEKHRITPGFVVLPWENRFALAKKGGSDLRWQVAKGEQFQALGLPKSEDGMLKVRVKAKKVTWIAVSCRILTLTVAKLCSIQTCSLWERHTGQANSKDMMISYLKDWRTQTSQGPWFLPRNASVSVGIRRVDMPKRPSTCQRVVPADMPKQDCLRRHAKKIASVDMQKNAPVDMPKEIVSVDMQKNVPVDMPNKIVSVDMQKRLFPSTCQTRLSPSTCKKNCSRRHAKKCSRRHAKQDCCRRHAKKIVPVDMQKKFPVDMPKKIVSVDMPTEWSSICRHAKIRRQHSSTSLELPPSTCQGFCPSMCQGVLPVRMPNHLL